MTAIKQAGDFLLKVSLLVKYKTDKTTDEYKRMISVYEKQVSIAVNRKFGDIDFELKHEEKGLASGELITANGSHKITIDDGYQLTITAYAK